MIEYADTQKLIKGFRRVLHVAQITLQAVTNLKKM